MQTTSNREDKYIQILRDGLINKDEFMKLISSDKNNDTTPIYG